MVKKLLKEGFDKKFNYIVSQKIKEYRINNRYSSAAMAEIVGFKPNTYFYYEKGNRELPMSLILNYCSHFGIDYKVFIDEAITQAKSELEGTYALGED